LQEKGEKKAKASAGWKDYVAIAVALLESILLPIVVILILMVILYIIITIR
jgi:hypothetical protein